MVITSGSSGAHLNNFPLFKGFDVPHRRLAEVAAVFTIELADAFVSDLKGHCRSIETMGATPESGFAYVAVTPRQKGKTIWLEPVSDKDYNSAK